MATTKTKTKKWDAADHLKSGRDVVAYIEAAFEDGDSGVIAAALGDIARAKGMSRVARQAGRGRESLYKTLSAGGNPELGTVLRVLGALGIRLHAVPEPEVGQSSGASLLCARDAIRRAKVTMVVSRMRKRAAKAGTKPLSMTEINREIRDARRKRRPA